MKVQFDLYLYFVCLCRTMNFHKRDIYFILDTIRLNPKCYLYNILFVKYNTTSSLQCLSELTKLKLCYRIWKVSYNCPCSFDFVLFNFKIIFIFVNVQIIIFICYVIKHNCQFAACFAISEGKSRNHAQLHIFCIYKYRVYMHFK